MSIIEQNTNPGIVDIWEEAMSILESSGLNPAAFKSWIHPLIPYKIQDERFILLAKNEHIIPTVKARYMERIKNAVRSAAGRDFDFEILPEAYIELNKNVQKNKTARFVSNLRSKYVFENFVKGKCNEFAFTASLAVAEAPGKTQHNPLVLYGDVGLGKTHLMHSIGNYIMETDPDTKVLYTTSENLMNEFIASIREHKNQEFRDKYRNIDVLLVDDIQFLQEKEGTQEEFFHTFNALYNDNKQIVISSDKPPKELKTLENRLRSRFGMGLSVDVTMPDFETRNAILEKKVELEGIDMPKAVIRYIAKVVSSNIRELEGALNKVTAYAKLTKTEITVEMAERLIGKEEDPPEVNVEYIQDIVANYYGLTPDDIRGPKRTANISFSRHIAMYLSRMILAENVTIIGKKFGGRDHSTVIHACGKISEELESNEQLKKDIFQLEKKIKSDV